MLNKKQIKSVREHLEAAQNPLFFFDNDVDGLCSFLLLRRFIGRGKGVAVRSHPDIDVKYARKVQELGADYVFVLDRPELGQEFVSELENMGIPIVWIDHHEVDNPNYNYENLFIFNPTKNLRKSSEPVTYLSYRIANRKEDIWIALMGCIADHHLPKFTKDFSKRYPEYWSKSKIKKPFEALYGTEIGKLAKALSFGLKDSITHVVYLQNLLISAKSPADVFLSLESRNSFAKKYREVFSKYTALMRKAESEISDGLVFFRYGGDMSISADIANELCYRHPNKFVVVAYDKGVMSNLSIRGRGAKKILEGLLPSYEFSTGGGHDDAVGARIKSEDLDRFKEDVRKSLT